MKAEFVNPFLIALKDVLRTMAHTEMTPGKPRLKTEALALGDVSGVIGMVGTQTRGSFSLTFEKRLALTLYSRMLGNQTTEIDKDVIDMVGEITNMVTGGAKRLLGEMGYQFEMATPLIVAGPGHSITHRAKGPRIALPFDSDAGKAYIEICFE